MGKNMQKSILCGIGLLAAIVFLGLGCNNLGVSVDEGEGNVDGLLNEYVRGLIVNVVTRNSLDSRENENSGVVLRSDENEKYMRGTVVNLTAEAKYGYKFVGWSRTAYAPSPDPRDTSRWISITMDDNGAYNGNKYVTAYFEPLTQNITTGTNGWNTMVNSIKNGGGNTAYRINVSGAVDVPAGSDWTFGSAAGITVILSGDAVINTAGSGNLLRIKKDQRVIMSGLKLNGTPGNASPLIYCEEGELYIGERALVSGNGGGGVYVKNGVLAMTGGTISGNGKPASPGGGVYLDGGEFNMIGGTIDGNFASLGGGVYIKGSGTFNMTAKDGGFGAITKNTAGAGGGVCVDNGGTFKMAAGVIWGNVARDSGGGVFVSAAGALFEKAAGSVITGAGTGGATTVNDNAVHSGTAVIQGKGHAVWVSTTAITGKTSLHREASAHTDSELKYDAKAKTYSGGWE